MLSLSAPTQLQEFAAHSEAVNCLQLGRKSAQVLVSGGDDARVVRGALRGVALAAPEAAQDALADVQRGVRGVLSRRGGRFRRGSGGSRGREMARKGASERERVLEL